jgi:hypothetical protein
MIFSIAYSVDLRQKWWDAYEQQEGSYIAEIMET